MEQITIGNAQKMTSPNPFALLTVEKPDKSTNVMALSWWTYVSNHPAAIAVCLSNQGFSGPCIRSSGSFGLSIVGPALRERAFRAGTCSGRDGNKADALGIPLIALEGFGPKVVAGSRLCFSCKLINTLDVGDHTLYIGEVETILADSKVDALFAYNGYTELDTVPVK